MRCSFGEAARKETESLCHTLAHTSSTGSDTMSVRMQLAEAEIRAISKQRRLLERLMMQSEEERRAAANERQRMALARRDDLLKKLQEVREAKDVYNSNKNDNDAQTVCVEERGRQWAAVYGEVALRREQLAHVLSCSSTALQVESFTDAVESLTPFVSAAHRAICALNNNNNDNDQAPHKDVPTLPTHSLLTQLEQVSKMHLQVIPTLNRERHRKSLLQENTGELFRDQGQLLAWCVEQQETLNNLNDMKSLREFCTSFMSNVAMMDTNFLVLLGRSERLAANRAVREALTALSRAWMELAVAMYEKMHRTVQKEHESSGIESACSWWLDTFEPQLKSALVAARDIFTRDDMQSNARMRTLWERSKSLLRDLETCYTIPKHISNFGERESCILQYEEALREALLTRFSLLTQTFAGDAKYDGQQEYADRLREVSDWLDAQAAGTIYIQLIRRVEKLRSMVEEQLLLLPEGDTFTRAAES